MTENDTAVAMIQLTGKSTDEDIPETLGFISDEVNTGFNATLFVLLSDINGIKKLIELGGQYLFPIAFGLKAADWLFYAWKVLRSPNPHIGRTSNLFLKTITTVLVGFAVFGTAFISAALAPILFTIAIGADLLASFAKTIYFARETSLAKQPHEIALYRKKAWENGIKSAVTLVIAATIVLGMIFAPIVPIVIIATVAIIAAVTLVTLGILGIVNRVRAARAKDAWVKSHYEVKEENKIEKEKTIDLKNSQVDLLIEEVAPIIVDDHVKTIVAPIVPAGRESFLLSDPKYPSFFANKVNLLTPIINGSVENDIAELMKTINEPIIGRIPQLKKIINDDSDNFIEKYVWSEGSKRQNKVNALEFLNDFITDFDKIKNNHVLTPAKTTFRIIIHGQEFDYINTNDLIMKIDKHIADHYPKAYHSYFKEIGDTQALFMQAYKLLIAKVRSAPSNDAPIPITLQDAKL